MVLKAGVWSAGNYQIAGDPWLTGSFLSNSSELKLEFPWITRSFTIFNTGSNALRTHFVASSSNSLVYDNHHYFTIGAGSSLTMNVKCKEVWISNASGGGSGFEFFAELTNVNSLDYTSLSGSGINT